MLFSRAHRRLLSEMVLPQLEALSKASACDAEQILDQLAAIAKQLEPQDAQVSISAHTAELLDVYRKASGEELGLTLTRDLAVVRLVQVFIGNPLAAKELRRQEVLNG